MPFTFRPIKNAAPEVCTMLKVLVSMSWLKCPQLPVSIGNRWMETKVTQPSEVVGEGDRKFASVSLSSHRAIWMTSPRSETGSRTRIYTYADCYWLWEHQQFQPDLYLAAAGRDCDIATRHVYETLAEKIITSTYVIHTDVISFLKYIHPI